MVLKMSRTSLIYLIVGSALSIAIILAGVWGYRTYRVSREASAQQVFADCMHEYSMAKAGHGKWDTVEQLCKKGYEDHKSSNMAPYFLVMQADAMLGGNKKELKKQAMLLFDQARSLLPKTSPLSYLYATKQALVSIDTYEGNSDNADESWGVDQLKKLAIDAKNPQRDVALYYLGLYYSSKNQADQATATWKELVALHEGQKTASPWASRAQAALQ